MSSFCTQKNKWAAVQWDSGALGYGGLNFKWSKAEA